MKKSLILAQLLAAHGSGATSLSPRPPPAGVRLASVPSTVPGGVSLPPVSSTPAVPQLPQLPQSLRPSLFPSARAAWSAEPPEGPAERPQCRDVIAEVDRNESSGTSPLLRALRGVVAILDPRAREYIKRSELSQGSDSKPLHDDELDKQLQAAGQVIRLSFKTPEVPARWGLIARMRHCAVDDLGRTILMKVVAGGFRSSLQTLTSMFGTSRSDLANLKDKENNNLMHLAVGTQDPEMVTVVAEMLGSTYAVEAFRTPNLEMKLPLDLADSGSMYATVKTYYHVLDQFGDSSHLSKFFQRGPHTELATQELPILPQREEESVPPGGDNPPPIAHSNDDPQAPPRGTPASPVPECGDPCEDIVPPAVIPRSEE